jgi:hypothetical protein
LQPNTYVIAQHVDEWANDVSPCWKNYKINPILPLTVDLNVHSAGTE